jgi:hypothetical protein
MIDSDMVMTHTVVSTTVWVTVVTVTLLPDH